MMWLNDCSPHLKHREQAFSQKFTGSLFQQSGFKFVSVRSCHITDENTWILHKQTWITWKHIHISCFLETSGVKAVVLGHSIPVPHPHRVRGSTSMRFEEVMPMPLHEKSTQNLKQCHHNLASLATSVTLLMWRKKKTRTEISNGSGENVKTEN